MEFLKSLFEKGALTWEQFQQAAKDAKFEVVNAAGGAYVPKADLDTKAQELTTANNTIKDLRAAAKAWDGKDPKKLEDDLKTLQTKYDTDTANIRRDAAIDLALTRAHARDPQLTRAALSMDDIKIGTDGKVTGLDAQLETSEERTRRGCSRRTVQVSPASRAARAETRTAAGDGTRSPAASRTR